MKLKKLSHFGFFLSFLLIYSYLVQAQDVSVKNVRFEDKGETVIVKYDLEGKVGKTYKINLFLSDDNGATFLIQPETLSGDVGKNISSGSDKIIIWHLKQDYPEGLSGDQFVFAVDAELQKGGSKLPYILAGTAGILGGMIYFITQSSGQKEPESTTGTIIIDVPKDF